MQTVSVWLKKNFDS